MAVDIWTIILTSVCTGIGISIGNGIYDLYFKDYLKKLKKQNSKLKHLKRRFFEYKRPWLAALLNVFFWGIGYFYVKRKRLLGAALLLVQIFVIGGYASGQGNWQNVFEGATYSFLTVILAIYLGVDAYKLARQVNSGKY